MHLGLEHTSGNGQWKIWEVLEEQEPLSAYCSAHPVPVLPTLMCDLFIVSTRIGIRKELHCFKTIVAWLKLISSFIWSLSPCYRLSLVLELGHEGSIEPGWKRDFTNMRKEESEGARSEDQSVEMMCFRKFLWYWRSIVEGFKC